MKTNWIKSLTTGLVAALIAPTCACASQLTNKSPLRGVSSLSADSGLKIDFQNRSKFEFAAIGGGIDGSGGGSVIKCVVGGKAQYTLLDYQEAAQRNIQVDLGAKSLSVGQKIETVLGRLAIINPARAKQYAKLVNAYQENVDMRSGVNFGKTPDVVDEIVPKGCDRVQVVIQINPELPGDKRFVTNGDVWNELDSETKAGIILHEIAYYDQGMKSARKLRYFNAMMASVNLPSMTVKDFYQLVVSTEMQGASGYNVTPTSHCLGDATFDADGELLFAYGCIVQEKNFNKGNWNAFFNWMASQKPVTVLGAIDFYDQNMIEVKAKDRKEVQFDEIKFKWTKESNSEIPRDYSEYYGLSSRGGLYDTKAGVIKTLFKLEDMGATIDITTNKASFKYVHYGENSTKLPCPERWYADDDLHLYKILKDKLILAYQCEGPGQYADKKVMFFELAR